LAFVFGLDFLPQPNERRLARLDVIPAAGGLIQKGEVDVFPLQAVAVVETARIDQGHIGLAVTCEDLLRPKLLTPG
jgi:hypothetical protein